MTSVLDRIIRASELRYRNLFENVPICVFMVDLSAAPAAILEANRRMVKVYGYTAGEVVGILAVNLVPEHAKPVFLSTMQRVHQGQTVTVKLQTRRKNGITFPARITAAPDPIDANQMIATVEDITASVQRRQGTQRGREAQRKREAKAIDAERRRIAQDIHDSVAQNLGSLRLKSALWQHMADSVPPPCAMH